MSMITTLNEYQNEVLRTLYNPEMKDADPRLFISCMTLGLTGEAGEVADLVKKEFWHLHPPDKTKMIKELGDVLWYVTALAELHGETLESVANANAAKLRARYEKGFTSGRESDKEARMKVLTRDDYMRARDAHVVRAHVEIELDEVKRLQQLKPQEFAGQLAKIVDHLVRDNIQSMVKFGAIKLPLEPVQSWIEMPRDTYEDYTEDEDGYWHGVGDPTGTVPAKLALSWELQVALKENP